MNKTERLNLENQIMDFYYKIDVHQSYFSTVYNMLNESMKEYSLNEYINLYNDYSNVKKLNTIVFNFKSISNIEEVIQYDVFKSLGINRLADIKEEILEDPEKLMGKILVSLEEKYKVRFKLNKKDEETKISIAFSSKVERDRFQIFINNYNKSKRQIRILFETSLINLTNIYEYFIQSIVYEWIRTYPNKLNGSEKTITYGELINEKDIESVHQRIINDYVRNFMFGSCNEWFQKLSKNNNKVLKKINDKEVNKVNEIFARRNIVVHNNGIINNSYLSIVKDSGFNQGEKVKLSSKYLDEIADDLLISGLKIAYCYWEIDHKDIDSMKNKFNLIEQDIGLDLINSNKPRTASKVLKILFDEKTSFTKDLQLRLTINYALSLKNNNGSFKEVVESEDFSVCGDEHRLCLAALEDNIDEVIKLFKQVIKSGFEDFEYLIDWPVLSNAKKDEKFKKFIKTTYKEKVKQFENDLKDSE